MLIALSLIVQMTDALKNLLTSMWEATAPEDREPFERKEAEDQARYLPYYYCTTLYCA